MRNSAQNPGMGYRPDIDGLRGVAILFVLFYHAFPEGLPGGYVGVDVFFVISGYLITGILLNNLTCDKFGFFEFYSRRIIRIFPALIVVLLSCFVAGWFVLLPDEYALLGKHIAAGAGFVENIVLWLEAGYFDLESEKKPLLHLWSLAVEEQFYLLFPVALWIVHRRTLGMSLLVLFFLVASLAVSVTVSYHYDGSFAFFSPITRFWELMFGALLAFRNFRGESIFNLHGAGASSRQFIAKYQATLLSSIGLLMVVASAFLLDRSTTYPGTAALLPVVGATLIILSGVRAAPNRYLLESRVFVFIGKISYPLYLWHWPLLSFPLIMTGEPLDQFGRMAVLVCSFVLATLTYYLVEMPIRGNRRGYRWKAISLALLMIVVGYVGYNSYSRGGLDFRLKKVLLNNVQHQFRQIPDSVAYLNNCVKRYSYFRGGCMLAQDNEPTVALLGDSHSLNLFHGLADLTKEGGGINVLNLRRDSALFLHGVATYGRDTESHNRKEASETAFITRQAVKIITDSPTIGVVILLLRGPVYISGEKKTIRLPDHPDLLDGKVVWRQAMENTLSILRGANKKVIALLDWPDIDFDPKVCQSSMALAGKQASPQCSISRAAYEERNREFHDLVKSFLRDHPDVVFFDAPQYFCDGERCRVERDGNILYVDTHHLSLYGARYLGSHLVPVINEGQEASGGMAARKLLHRQDRNTPSFAGIGTRSDDNLNQKVQAR